MHDYGPTKVYQKKEKSHNLPTPDLVGCLLEVLNIKQKKGGKKTPIKFPDYRQKIKYLGSLQYQVTKGEENVYLHRLKVRVSGDYSIHFF